VLNLPFVNHQFSVHLFAFLYSKGEWSAAWLQRADVSSAFLGKFDCGTKCRQPQTNNPQPRGV
jgi:hypothetical protein